MSRYSVSHHGVAVGTMATTNHHSDFGDGGARDCWHHWTLSLQTVTVHLCLEERETDTQRKYRQEADTDQNHVWAFHNFHVIYLCPLLSSKNSPSTLHIRFLNNHYWISKSKKRQRDSLTECLKMNESSVGDFWSTQILIYVTKCIYTDLDTLSVRFTQYLCCGEC